jgi:hypothetical protein
MVIVITITIEKQEINSNYDMRAIVHTACFKYQEKLILKTSHCNVRIERQ